MSTRPSPCTRNDHEDATPAGDARSAATRSPRPRGQSCTSLDAPPGDAQQLARLDEHDDEVTEAAVSALVLNGFADKMRMREQLLVYDAAYHPPVRGSRLYHRRAAVMQRLSQCVARWAIRDEIIWVAMAYYDRICYEMGEAARGADGGTGGAAVGRRCRAPGAAVEDQARAATASELARGRGHAARLDPPAAPLAATCAGAGGGHGHAVVVRPGVEYGVAVAHGYGGAYGGVSGVWRGRGP
eukprot:ctg_483.g141